MVKKLVESIMPSTVFDVDGIPDWGGRYSRRIRHCPYVHSQTRTEAGTSPGYVRLVSDGCWTAHARGYNTGIETCMGKTVVFEIGAVRVLIASAPP
jgi:hypothetical protein